MLPLKKLPIYIKSINAKHDNLTINGIDCGVYINSCSSMSGKLYYNYDNKLKICVYKINTLLLSYMNYIRIFIPIYNNYYTSASITMSISDGLPIHSIIYMNKYKLPELNYTVYDLGTLTYTYYNFPENDTHKYAHIIYRTNMELIQIRCVNPENSRSFIVDYSHKKPCKIVIHTKYGTNMYVR